MPLPHKHLPDQQIRRNFEALDRELNQCVRASATALTGERDDPESALANLIALLENAGILTDNTTAT